MTEKIDHTQAPNKWGVVCKTETLRVNYGDYNCMSKRGIQKCKGITIVCPKGGIKKCKVSNK